jgi:hypothetical protein
VSTGSTDAGALSGAIDAMLPQLCSELAELVRIPSISGAGQQPEPL